MADLILGPLSVSEKCFGELTLGSTPKSVKATGNVREIFAHGLGANMQYSPDGGANWIDLPSSGTGFSIWEREAEPPARSRVTWLRATTGTPTIKLEPR